MCEQANNPYEDFLQKLPCDWERLAIREIGTITGGGTPSREIPSYWHGDIPWVTPGEISSTQTQLLHRTQEHISHTGLNGSGANLLPAGSLMVTTRATLGARAINAVSMATNQGFKSIIFKNLADGGYYFHLFEKVKPELVRRASGTTFLEISGAEFGNIQVPNPPNLEKKLIVQILDTLDTAICETEALIDKLKVVKHGLLHDLLSRGINVHGQLRPPQSEAPQLYKESPLGWIPKEWEVKPAESVCEAVIDCKNRTPPIVESGHPVVRTPNVRDGRFVFTELVFTDEASYKIWTQRGRPRPGDVLITREAPVGEVCLVPADMQEACLGQRMMMYQPDPSLLRSDFMLIALMSQPVQRVLIDKAGGSTVGHVRVGDIRLLAVPVPPLTEQVKIVDQYQAAVERLSAEESTLVKLRYSKVGLMNDLLTGYVRVTSLGEALS
ncbi:restriction endonuclease subunit S [Pseudomonas sp. SWRI100]|uniref:restriction endonuclease subunit S n=1 Tax=Pseudomonas TaxID=286 RepID=UPI001649166D|nr:MULTISPECIES: restriction endonuclease subunit S [Pseudomonas]MBC3494439.1 restriction endonuclease subunit S [Pseudomonas sp. SWRI67]MBV4528821.1 restriction endonuclease subunit S [Pseudomonas kermanshahensis]